MGFYKYSGVNINGKDVKGTIDSDNIKTARIKLKQEGIYVTKIVEKSVADVEEKKKTLNISIGKNVKRDDITMMTRQFSTLVNANIPIVDTLEALSTQVENEKLKIILKETKQKVNEGSSIADGLSTYSDIFSPLYVNMIRAGEASGTLGVVLDRLATYTQKQSIFRNKLISSMAYPVLMIIIAVVIIGILFVVVIPKITAIFEDMDAVLPIYTTILIWVSTFIKDNFLYIVGFLIISFFLFRKYINTKSGRIRWDFFKLNFPFLGKIVRVSTISQFTRTLSTLVGAGVPLIQSIDIVTNVIQNQVIKNALLSSKDLISEGESLAKTLQNTKQFPPIVTNMISVGEKTGELAEMLEHVSDAYEQEATTKIDAVVSLIEPVMILVMGGTVAFVVMAILVPIMQMSNI